ncbi:hypothetical protein GCM10010495_65750 [Kitasatospora herbaricolor]|uniref:hypothetical protein n=1 Tax=Kitasatospora herbaricolor TaxID=68217 RepID=UPI0017496391|nr:hypothetical protein [Kitasatospora herbaricolor]MDQ0313399.1 M6 family metalloprotease-like protein [Kitasatospora herbaricolor]GGV39252.1 hypothetical protein GCM10010495_65750 [Kitasatospora herbaricolor]
MITHGASLDEAVAAAEDVDRGLVWIVEAGQHPGLSSWDRPSGRLTRHLDLAGPPGGVALSGDRTEVLVALRDGPVLAVAAADPGAGPHTVGLPGHPLGQLAASRPTTGRGHALVVDDAPSQVVAVRLADGQVRDLVTLTGLTGVTARAQDVWVAATTAGEGRLLKVTTGSTQGVAAGLLPTGHLTVSQDRELLLTAHPSADRLSVLRFADGSLTTRATDLAELDGPIVEAHALDDGTFLILTTRGLALTDDLDDLPMRPRLVPPAEPLFVGSWVPLQYDLTGTALTDDDVSFTVIGDPDAALVSHTSAVPGPGGHRVALLVAGGLLGSFEVAMTEAATGQELDRARFEVTDHWHDPDHGPSQMLQGDSSPAPAGDWGGGPSAPQNLGTQAHNGRWRTLVLLVDTADGAYPTPAADLAAARKAVLDEVQDGVPFNGSTRSARLYYEELSGWNAATGQGLTLQVYNNRVYGPVRLPNGWTTYFGQGKDAAGTVVDTRWSSLGATVQTIVTRTITDGLLTTADYRNIDVLLMVPFSPDAPGVGDRRFVWPHAQSALPYLAGTNAATDQAQFGFVFAPPDFATQDGRQLHTTLSHEIGHTLGLPDLYNFPSYTPDVTGRLTMGWDMMAGSRDTLPHYSLSNRMRQGWVGAADLKLYNFSGTGSVNESVTLHAAELGSPPPGRKRGIEIRLADGWNTYVEYRARQGTQIGDTLPTDRRVVITDVTSDAFVTPNARPPVMFVHNDDDGDGPILDTPADYEDKDPATQKSLRVKVASTAADNAVVTVEYGSDGRPDPGIRPWTGGPAWQSPDIEVRNARSKADPARWFNVPWIGNPNTVVAKIRNGGDLLCKGVVVDFFAVEFTTGDGPMVPLGSDTHDIKPGEVREFTAGWTPTDTGGHYCIVVRIRLYQDPTVAGVVETNIYNNEARSNYTRFVSATASPSTRVAAEVRLANPYEASTLVQAAVHQTHRLHRVYLDHRWLRVPGGSSLPVRILDEALAGFPGQSDQELESLWARDNQVSVEGWAARPFPTDCGSRTLTGGAAVSVGAGRATLTRLTEAGLSWAAGTVEHLDDGSGAQDGAIVVVAQESDPDGAVDPIGDRVTAQGTVQGGRFTVEFPRPLQSEYGVLQAHFLGAFGAAPSDSEPRAAHG